MRAPLRIRLTAWFAVAVLAIVTPYAVAVLVLEWRRALSALDHHLQEDFEVAAQMLRRGPSGLYWASGESVDRGYDAGDQRWVEVFGPSGEVLYTRGIARMPAIRASLPAPGGDGFERARTPAGAHVRLFTATRAIAGTGATIRVARSEDSIRAEWRALVVIFLLTIPAAVLAAGGVGHVLARRALAPLARMTSRARMITAARLDERLTVENPADELGELALVFNGMIERIEDAFQRLRRFTADASHELRTPLTALRSVGEVGLREPRSPADYREIIGSMLEEAARLARLIDNLLALSRFDAGRVTLTPERVDLGDLAAEVVAHLGVLAEEKGIEIRLRRSGRAVVMADRQMLRQAAINILDNAIKYSLPQQPVEVETGSSDGRCSLSVKDHGPGIPPEHQPRVFDRFYRVDPARARDVDGTGLGLSIARWAVTANHGNISLESVEGHGSRFTMSLPPAA